MKQSQALKLVESSTASGKGSLALRFGSPPFSVLDARAGTWQERKRQWKELGLQSELGRGQNLLGGNMFSGDWARERKLKSIVNLPGTSIFDPVTCETVYRWFCPLGGQIVDPFAGGSVRGVVAGRMGFDYWGVDLRPEQIAENRQQAWRLLTARESVQWVTGDAIDEVPRAPLADLVFSCPPYGNLERYSDDPRDISTMEYHTFLAAYKRVIARCAERLKDDRFACFVVGDFRDNRGNYRGFVADTIRAFEEQGLHLYNEAIYLQPVGSAPLRAAASFNASRKLAKVHQNILVFIKGNAQLATQAIKCACDAAA